VLDTGCVLKTLLERILVKIVTGAVNRAVTERLAVYGGAAD
jgi:hypothetical protein